MAEARPVGVCRLKGGRVNSVIMNDVAPRPPRASGEKRVERDIGDPYDAVRHGQADPAHRLAKQHLLEAARRRHVFIRIVGVNDAPADRNPCRGE